MNAKLELFRRAAELATERALVDLHGGYAVLDALKRCERDLRARCERLAAERVPDPDPKSAWLLDNYSFIQSQIREVRDAVPRSYYRHLPRFVSGDPRVYRLAAEIVALAGPDLSVDTLRAFVDAYQEIEPLTLAEVWALGPMVKIALIERIADPGAPGAIVRDAILGLQALETASWRDFVESVSIVHRELCSDPAGIYPRSDFSTRDACRHAVEGIARRSGLSEQDVARLVLDLSADAQHVPYYLLGRGLEQLERRAGFRRPLATILRRIVYRHPNLFYFGAAAALTALIAAAALQFMSPAPWWIAILLFVPASQVALAALNPLVNMLVPPRVLPRLDFDEGIPDDCRTFVVVPTLLLSRPNVERLLERLEIHYIANRDPNLRFALLTDFADSNTPETPEDTRLLDLCAEGIRILNRRYEGAPFYLFHRRREFNESEGIWMGHERKRGKLVDFNRLLLARGDAFSRKVGDLSIVGSIRFVITLDSDTQLPLDTARKMVATIAHPLNRPALDAQTRTVREGFGILQPRISVSMESAGRSRLAHIYSGQTGFDPYTTAVSDVYQDLHSAASFTGKGIYDLYAFEAAAGDRFPDNTLLSHDLIEGEHARTGLMTDIELIDDYPTTYQAYCKRKHRWVRGDWQIAAWLLPKVPLPGGMRAPNPLSALSRWKIADNLRRSLLEIVLLALLAWGWMADPFRGTALVFVLLAAPAWIDLALSLIRTPVRRRYWHAYFRELVFRFLRGHLDAALNLATLPHQALLMVDAIGRTLYRACVSRRRLLEWESMAQVEEGAARRRSAIDRYLYWPPVVAFLAGFLVPMRGWMDAVAPAVLELWVASPLIVRWLNAAPSVKRSSSARDREFLRDAALRTWRFFVDLAGPENNWIAPDNIQEDPPRVAHRTSPTNLGLLLGAQVAACDFGYLTTQETAARLESVLESLGRMPRERGHFYNWYDTRTLRPLARYISTVDSGNLAAALVSVKQACIEAERRPALGFELLDGIRDHAIRLRNALPPSARTSSIARILAAVLRQVEYHPADLFCWEGLLSEVRVLTERLREPVERAGARLGADDAAEADYWYHALSRRVDAALAELRAVAPWLSGRFEQEVRLSATDPGLRKLLRTLERVVPLSGLAAQYDAIEAELNALTALPKPALHGTLAPLRAEIRSARRRAAGLLLSLDRVAAVAGRLVDEMDFAFLFDRKRKLLRTGWDTATASFDPSYYDLLASEARTAVFLAIAKGDIPREAWFHLGRKLAVREGERTLYSWSGTMFEYLMPSLWMKSHDSTLLGESLKSAVRVQRRYGQQRRVPWGISEAAYSGRDSDMNYQYQAFGVPGTGLKRSLGDSLVVAPYASMLALMVDGAAATENLREMAAKAWTGRYGFYESADFTKNVALVRAFMAHHQAMSLLAMANVLLDNPAVRRFHTDPLVRSAEFLLQERVPMLFDTAPAEEPLPVSAAPVPTVRELEADAAG